MSLKFQVKERAFEIGFDLAGIAPIAAWHDLEFAQGWNERGYGGEMAYLKNPRRSDPRLILPSVKSIVCVGLVYNAPVPYSVDVSCQSPVVRRQLPQRPASSSNRDTTRAFEQRRNRGTHQGLTGHNGQRTTDDGPAREARGWISRYAWGRDYHQVMRSKLERLRAEIERLAPGVETRVYVDTGPIVERAFARLSGIGWMGKNTCLINQQKGSWFFIGVILTSLDLDSDTPAFDRCGSCRRCLDACPTGALAEPYVMDASRCIAYFNIELKGSIPAEFRPAIGANVFGCDICQDVCPWNRPLSSALSPLSPAEGSLSPAERRNSKFEIRDSEIEFQDPRRRAATTQMPEFCPLTVENRNSKLETRNSTIDGRRTNDQGLRTVQDEQRTTDNGQLTTDHGLRTSDRVSIFEFRFSLFNPRLEDLASLSEDDFRRIFRDSPVKRVKYRGWLRNLCVVMGNSADRRFLPWLERMRLLEDAGVREHAEWAIGRMAES